MIWLDLLYNKSEALSIFHPRESRAFQRFHFKARFVFLWGQNYCSAPSLAAARVSENSS